MAKQEYEGIAFTSAISLDGWQVSVTERASSSADALAKLEATIALMELEGYIPFVSYHNKFTDTVAPAAPLPVTPVDEVPAVSVVQHAVEELGAIINEVPAIPFDDGTPVPVSGQTQLADGTQYLGLKGSKMDDILEGQSYEVLANCYSYDTEYGWVNFFNGTKPAAGHKYTTTIGERDFKKMFPLFIPVVGADHAPIPTGAKKLYVVGVVGKDGKNYQNIKAVEDA